MNVPKKFTRAPAQAKVIWRGSPTLGSFYGFYAAGALFLFISGALIAILPRAALVALMISFCGIMFTIPFIFRRAWKFTVTDRHIYSEFHLIVHRTFVAPVENITDVVVAQGLVGRYLNFGDIYMCTAGTFFSGVVFWGIRDPFEVANKIRALLSKR